MEDRVRSSNLSLIGVTQRQNRAMGQTENDCFLELEADMKLHIEEYDE